MIDSLVSCLLFQLEYFIDTRPCRTADASPPGGCISGFDRLSLHAHPPPPLTPLNRWWKRSKEKASKGWIVHPVLRLKVDVATILLSYCCVAFVYKLQRNCVKRENREGGWAGKVCSFEYFHPNGNNLTPERREGRSDQHQRAKASVCKQTVTPTPSIRSSRLAAWWRPEIAGEMILVEIEIVWLCVGNNFCKNFNLILIPSVKRCCNFGAHECFRDTLTKTWSNCVIVISCKRTRTFLSGTVALSK